MKIFQPATKIDISYPEKKTVKKWLKIKYQFPMLALGLLRNKIRLENCFKVKRPSTFEMFRFLKLKYNIKVRDNYEIETSPCLGLAGRQKTASQNLILKTNSS